MLTEMLTNHPLDPSMGTVCVIDGDRGVRQSLRTLLSTLHVRVLTFPTAEEYLEGENVDRVTCLITETSLPGMGGLELVRTLRERGVLLPVIALTVEVNPRMTAEAERLGVLELVEKPFVYWTVLQRVQEALQTSRPTGNPPVSPLTGSQR